MELHGEKSLDTKVQGNYTLTYRFNKPLIAGFHGYNEI